MDSYKKIIVIGCPGSGKSYFSKILANATHLPLYHLDMIYWKPNWVSTPRDEFDQIVKGITDTDEWIIDGNYNRTIEDRLSKAELVYFLDLPTEVCLESVKARFGVKRDDLPNYLEEKEDPEFINFIKDFKNTGRVKIITLIEKYKDKKVITFTSREEINLYLNNYILNKDSRNKTI